jgi:hypothetical protein
MKMLYAFICEKYHHFHIYYNVADLEDYVNGYKIDGFESTDRKRLILR